MRTDRLGRLDLTVDDVDGRTTVHSSAVTDALEAEVAKVRGVAGASARILDRRGQRLELRVDLAEYADIAEVRQALEDRVVVHARQAIDDPDMPVDIELRPGWARSASRVVL
jgi:hypothetical protein